MVRSPRRRFLQLAKLCLHIRPFVFTSAFLLWPWTVEELVSWVDIRTGDSPRPFAYENHVKATASYNCHIFGPGRDGWRRLSLTDISRSSHLFVSLCAPFSERDSSKLISESKRDCLLWNLLLFFCLCPSSFHQSGAVTQNAARLS